MADEIIAKPIVAQPQKPPTPKQQVVISVQKVPTAVVEAENAVQQQTTNEFNQPRTDLIPNDNYITSPLFHEIASFFGIEPSEFEIAKDKISVITDYVINKVNSNKVEDIMIEIRKLEDNIQPPAWGEKRYNNIYKYLRLAAKRDSFDKALSAFERKPANYV